LIRIAHIADVHVRNLSRHPEYVEVFTAFVKRCKEQKVQHIFVGGDLYHTKTSGMSPECIEFFTWWFTELASVAEVHVTLGNHDFNLSNKTRQDAISPIVSALQNPRVHLYKDSGAYEIAPGYVLGVFSLFDPENWDNVKPVPGKVNIACYHGPVWGASTESDWLVEEGTTVEFFRGWDFCLLGDIHKFQFLAGRDVELEIDEADLGKHPEAVVLGEVSDDHQDGSGV
jgi:hypothetical protein